MKCVICNEEVDLHKKSNGEVYWDQGHNAEPVREGRCCDACNAAIVIPTRLGQLNRT